MRRNPLARRKTRASFCLGAGTALVLLVATLSAPVAQALSPTPAKTFVTNGPVYAIAPTASATYIGGYFTRVGPRTGPGVGIDSSTAKSTGLPQVAGGQQIVQAVASDGTGGFYIGGDFRTVGGVPHNNLAHILANGSVDPNFDPNPNSAVKTLATPAGSTVYAGGSFTSIGGQTRNRIAALDESTGNATSWNPNANADVWTLRVAGSTVYAGGDFTSIGGQTRNRIAALDASTGNATSWNPNADFTVIALAVSGSHVYVGGGFTSIGGQTRHFVAALNPVSGAATAWNPKANGIVRTLRPVGETVYAGGDFTSIGGRTRHRIAALNTTGGAATSWNPPSVEGFRSEGGGIGDPTVLAIAVSGSTVYAGGDFTFIGGLARNNAAAFNPATGAITGWNPNANSAVRSLAASGSTVYAGGHFTAIGGKARNHIAALNTTGGAATTWNPGTGRDVLALAVTSSRVYAGGNFLSIGGQPRTFVAALNRTTGAATSWNPNMHGVTCRDCPAPGVVTLAASGSILYVGGRFTAVDDQPRNNIAAIDVTSGAATSWNPNVPVANGIGVPTPVAALRVSGSRIYAGGFFDTIGGQTRNNIAALDVSTGNATAWNPNANGTVNAIALSGSTVYAGGGFTSIGGQPRNRIAGLDAASGAATSWNPNPNGAVRALRFGPEGSLWAGGDFNSFPTAAQSGIARFTP